MTMITVIITVTITVMMMMVVMMVTVISFDANVVVVIVTGLSFYAPLCVPHFLGKHVQAVSGGVLGIVRSAAAAGACRRSSLLEQASDLVFGGLEALRACEVLPVRGLYDALVDVHEDLRVGQPKALALRAELGEVCHVAAGLHYQLLRERLVLVEQVERAGDLDAHRPNEGRLCRLCLLLAFYYHHLTNSNDDNNKTFFF